MDIKSNAKLDNIFFNAIRKHNEIFDLTHKNKNKKSDLSSEESKDKQMANSEFDSIEYEECNGELSDEVNELPMILPIKFETKSNSVSRLSSPRSQKQKISISPVINKELEYFEKRKRVKRYIDSINIKSEYYRESRLKFRKRTFK